MKKHPQDVYGRGGDKGGSSSSTGAVEAPNTLQTQATARLVEIISHGETYGLIDLVNPLKSVFLDGTPVQNSDGSFNFNGFQLQERRGYPFQDPFVGFSDVESETGVGLDVTVPLPRTSTVTNNFVDAVRVKIQINSMTEQDTKTGDLNGSQLSYTIERRIVSGAWDLVLTENLAEKFTSPQQLSYRIERPPAATDTDDWEIRVTRITPDATVVTVQNVFQLFSVTEITDSNLMYSGLAGVAVTVDSKQFGGNIPGRSYDYAGMILDVPSNYTPPDPSDPLDPTKRVYTGIWDGTFKRAWSDNPAWILWAMLTDKEWGLGRVIEPEQVDKWSLYQIAQYCDEFVDDGTGTAATEPRYVLNTQITSQEEAFAMLQSVASAFRGMMYWGTGSVSFVADQPRDPVKFVSAANVIDGVFTYAGAALKARHSVAIVTWNDPTDKYRATQEVVEDPEMIQRFGWRPTSVVAYGCTSKGQAHRMGKWILDTERHETETVTFQVSYDNAELLPGQIIEVYDPSYAGTRYGGRLTAITSTTVTLDAAVLLEIGKTYTIFLITGDGLLVERAVTTTPDNATHTVLGWAADLAALPASGTTVTIFAESAIGDLQRGQIKTITTTSVTFVTAVKLNSGSAYVLTFTLPDGSVVQRDVTTTISSGTPLGSNEYELLTLSWSSALSTLPTEGTIAFVAPPNEGFASRVLSGDATLTNATITASFLVRSDYVYKAQFVRPDGVLVTRQLTNAAGSTTTLTWDSNEPLVQLPIVGGMWGITASDLAPRKFRVINKAEAEKNLFTITALNYDPNKYDRIEGDIILPDPGSTTDLSTEIPSPVTGIYAARYPTLQNDGTYIDYVQVGWVSSTSPFVNKYKVAYQYNGGTWTNLPDVTTNVTRFVSNGPGDYAFKVIAVNMIGLQSSPAFAGWTLTDARPFDGGNITNVHVENDLGATTVGDTIDFTTADLTVAWSVSPPSNWPDPGTITNWVDPYLLYYEVKLQNSTGTTTYATLHTSEERITITGDQIVQATGGSLRNFRLSIAMVDAYATYTPTVQKFANLAPANTDGRDPYIHGQELYRHREPTERARRSRRVAVGKHELRI
jgi:predicted phage tail protein